MPLRELSDAGVEVGGGLVDIVQDLADIGEFGDITTALLELRHERFVVTGAERQPMVVYHAEPGTRSQALQELAAASASRSPTPGRPWAP